MQESDNMENNLEPLKSPKIKEYFHKKFNIYAFIQLTIGVILFIIMIFLIIPDLKDVVNDLSEIVDNPDTDVMGYDLILHFGPFFKLFMYTFQIFYCLYGIIVLFKYQNERQVFKIIFRNIFYISTVLLVVSLMLFCVWLLSPIKDIYSMLFIFMSILVLIVSIGGRFVSNFSLVNMSLKKRKSFGYVTIIAYMASLVWTLVFATTGFGLKINGEVPETSFLEIFTDYTFYILQIITSFFSLGACYYFKDDMPMKFEPEPNIKKAILPEIIDIPLDLAEITDHQFSKNTKITRAIIPDNIKEISIGAFANCVRLREVSLPHSLTKISYNSFFNCHNLIKISYDGTKKEFEQIEKEAYWLARCGTNTISCNDGEYTVIN